MWITTWNDFCFSTLYHATYVTISMLNLSIFHIYLTVFLPAVLVIFAIKYYIMLCWNQNWHYYGKNITYFCSTNNSFSIKCYSSLMTSTSHLCFLLDNQRGGYRKKKATFWFWHEVHLSIVLLWIFNHPVSSFIQMWI